MLPSEVDQGCLQGSPCGNSLQCKPFLVKTFVAQGSFLDGSKTLDPSLVKYYFITTIKIGSSINCD